MSIQNMNDLFLHQLKDIYFAENQILKALPKMSEKATSPDLSEAFDAHLDETETHVERLKQIFERSAKKPQGEECPAIEGIIKEAEELMGEIEHENTLDAALIASAQAVEHYEITRYGTLVGMGSRTRIGRGCRNPQYDSGRGIRCRCQTHGSRRNPHQRRVGRRRR